MWHCTLTAVLGSKSGSLFHTKDELPVLERVGPHLQARLDAKTFGQALFGSTDLPVELPLSAALGLRHAR